MSTETKTTKSLLNLISAMFVFGTIGIFVRYIPLPSSVIALVRGCIGTVFLLAVTLFKKSKINLSDIKRNLPTLCISGVFIGINWILLFEAYRYTTVAVATLCYYFAPIFVVIASQFLFKERLTVIRAACVFFALCGMVLVSGVLSSGGGFNATGVLLGLGAAAFYAGVVLLNKRLKDISSYDTTIVQLLSAAIVLLPYTLLTEPLGALRLTAVQAVLLLTVGIIHTGIAYTMYFSAIKGLKAQTAAIFSYIDPVVAILLSALILHEKLDVYSIVGALLILGSAFFSETIGKPKA